MIGFEISLNGKRLYTMGVEDFRNLNFTTQWARLKSEDGTIHEFTGSVGVAGCGTNMGTWPAIQGLKVGDQVTLRIVDVDTFDPPEQVKPLPELDYTSATTNVHRVRYEGS